MEYRLLGRSGLKVSAFSFGAMTFGGGEGFFARIGHTVGKAAERQVDMCLEAGVNLFDTADVYHNGQSEEVLGEVVGGRRSRVLIATKCFARMGPDANDLGSSRHHIVRACEASLKRLRTDYIDLYQMHSQDLATPPEETARALDDLVRQGKVRYIGSSNYSGWVKMRALATADRLGLERYVSQQVQYSLLTRDVEHELLPLGVSEGVGALIWGPLASGYLTGKFRQPAGADPTRIGAERLHEYDSPRGRRILDVLQEIAGARSGVSLGQVALNWVARQPGVSSIILGARTAAQLADNLAAATWSLTDEEVRRLTEASQQPPPYPYSHQQMATRGRTPARALQPPIPAA
jgi:aryl-alcohol dehydrogenase-like predicted oxidoreductase